MKVSLVAEPSALDPDFVGTVHSILNDPLGWRKLGVTFNLGGGPRPDIVVRLVATADMRRMFPDAHLKDLSVTNMATREVFIHAGRWLQHLPNKSGLSPSDYKKYVINHEIGHCFQLRHPPPNTCTPDGLSDIMNQQTLGTSCKPNPLPSSAYFGFIASAPG